MDVGETMSRYDLSILIPARNEMFLEQTIKDILKNKRAKTEVIAVLDGEWAVGGGIDAHPDVSVVYVPESIGQRAATNAAAKMSDSKWIMKVDAHCAFDVGFDNKLIEDIEPRMIMIPAQYNLHAFDWVCAACGQRKYQGKKPESCDNCGGEEHEMSLVWQPRRNRLTVSWRFDEELRFQYWGDFKNRPEGQGQIIETMCCLGACWMMEREYFWEIGGLDELHGSWGQMGVELGCKAWLSGGKMVCNKKTWFAHMFRTQDGFGFPYKITHAQQEKARDYSRDLWMNDKWEPAVRSFDWILEHFAPVPGWHDEDPAESGHVEPAAVATNNEPAEKELQTGLRKGIVYYTDNRLNMVLMRAVWKTLEKRAAENNMEIISVSLEPIPFGKNIVAPWERGYLTMFKQILFGLLGSSADVIYFCEHDVLYHPSHFEFNPPDSQKIFYNENVYKVDAESGKALFYYCKQTSGIVADRQVLIDHYLRRVRATEHQLMLHGETRAFRDFIRRQGFEPGTHSRRERVDDLQSDSFMSEFPIVDIRHDANLTPSRFKREQFRDQRYTRGWKESDDVPGWGRTLGRFHEFLSEVSP